MFDDYARRGTPVKNQLMSIDLDMKMSADLKIYPDKPLAKIPEAYQARNEEFRKLNPQGQDLVRWKYQTYVKDYLRCITQGH